jgi:hypothetical protein
MEADRLQPAGHAAPLVLIPRRPRRPSSCRRRRSTGTDCSACKSTISAAGVSPARR